MARSKGSCPRGTKYRLVDARGTTVACYKSAPAAARDLAGAGGRTETETARATMLEDVLDWERGSSPAFGPTVLEDAGVENLSDDDTAGRLREQLENASPRQIGMYWTERNALIFQG